MSIRIRTLVGLALLLAVGCQDVTPSANPFIDRFALQRGPTNGFTSPTLVPYPVSPYIETVGDRQHWSDALIATNVATAPMTLTRIAGEVTNDKGEIIEHRILEGKALQNLLGDESLTFKPNAKLFLGPLHYEHPTKEKIETTFYTLTFRTASGDVESSAEVRPSFYEQRSIFRLPFANYWHVLTGHAPGSPLTQEPSWRFGWKFSIVDQWGRPYKNQGLQNSDYYCFGQPVVATAPGVVVVLVDEQPDNQPNQLTPGVHPSGNHLVIKHNQKEFSFYMHLRANSIQVQSGQWVQPGQVLGAVGNSGVSYTPRLHYHVQDNALVYRGFGLPIKFSQVSIRDRYGVVKRQALHIPQEKETITNYAP